MADQSLLDSKIEASRQLVDRLVQGHAPLLAAYWEWTEEKGRWTLFLVPVSMSDERRLVDEASDIMIQAPFRSAFSLSDAVVDGHQIERAKAIAKYVQTPRDIGRRFDTTFTRGHYFEGVIVMYVAPVAKATYAA